MANCFSTTWALQNIFLSITRWRLTLTQTVICFSSSGKHKWLVGHCIDHWGCVHLSGSSSIYAAVQHKGKTQHPGEQNSNLRAPQGLAKVKCTANRFRASLESGAIWLLSSVINEKYGLISGLIDCVIVTPWICSYLSFALRLLTAEVTKQT